MKLIDYASNEVKKNIVCQKFGKPDDIATMVGILCRNEASFINRKANREKIS